MHKCSAASGTEQAAPGLVQTQGGCRQKLWPTPGKPVHQRNSDSQRNLVGVCSCGQEMAERSEKKLREAQQFPRDSQCAPHCALMFLCQTQFRELYRALVFSETSPLKHRLASLGGLKANLSLLNLEGQN